jgi:hypothetical protein
VVGYHLVDTIEVAALKAINIFCDQHPEEVAEYPIGLFPAVDSRDPEWVFRVSHCAICWEIWPKRRYVLQSDS